MFNLYEDRKDPHAFVLYERWATAKAHQDHLGQSYSASFDHELVGMMASLPETLVLNDRIEQ
ncbi:MULTISPECIES: putative quinol monooxygenase [unclassified Pseudomonas]|uniref:putative quinol monooxygenase n=1 Tax=unclassified Pseudomonas TaxID=196821 RepID=UPI00093008C6|nr:MULTISPECIES: antibiotic biosynthesis monooxygenase [unclassified Pseudomonas]